jgi:hypothetical protein
MVNKLDLYFTRDDGVNIPELDVFDYTDRQKERVEKKVSETFAVNMMRYREENDVVGTVVVSEPEEIEMGLSPVQFVMVHN